MIKNNTNKICFIILNILVIIIFLPWLMGQYATDDYNIMNVGYKYYSIHNSLLDGRVIMFAILQLIAAFNISFEVADFILLFLALLVSNICVFIVKNVVYENMENKNIKNQIVSYIIGFTCIYNFMYIENLYFLESFVMAISILLNLIAAKIFANQGKKYLLKTTGLILISVFCYQGTISSFLGFVLLFDFIKKQSFKNYIKNFIIATIIVGVACICNFAFVKLISAYLGLQQTRLNNNILYNIIYILTTKLYMLIYTSNNFYYGLFFLIFSSLTICFIYLFKSNIDKLEKFMFLIFGSIFCIDLPYLVSLTAFNAGRTRFVIGALCSIIIICILTNSKEICEKYKEKVKAFLRVFIVIYFILNLVNYVEIINNTKISNQCEKEYVEMIDKYISEYERENNTVVEKIQLVYANDANNAFFPSVKRKNVMTWNACSCSWSAVGVINFYTNRNLVPKSSDKFIEMEMHKMYEIKDDVLYVKIKER